ncbi:MAG: alpha/beta hydrolase fold domain-containing protein [Vicinamibacterales bacterium]
MRTAVIAVAIALVASTIASAQTAAEWAAVVANEVRVAPGITYLTASNWDAKLDVYRPATPGPHPTLLHIHGGGWTGGSRESVVLRALPFVQMGFAVVNVSYRLARVAPAPAAVEDCLCALKWIAQNAKEYEFDLTRVAVTGYSAGGHLALTTGMVPASAGLDRQCPGAPLPQVAAVVNWYGITDVNDLLEGANQRVYAVTWLGSLEARDTLARRLSPLTYVRRDLPPVLTIHGDADPTVPYNHGTRLHAALQSAGAASELVTIPQGRHGNFPRDQQLRAMQAVRAFLVKHGVLRASPSSTARP